MVDRLISRGLSVLVIGLITLTFGGALVFGYRGLFELLEGNLAASALRFGGTFPLSLAAWMLARNRDDLMDRF